VKFLPIAITIGISVKYIQSISSTYQPKITKLLLKSTMHAYLAFHPILRSITPIAVDIFYII
jgi:hypothetical protein